MAAPGQHQDSVTPEHMLFLLSFPPVLQPGTVHTHCVSDKNVISVNAIVLKLQWTGDSPEKTPRPFL